VQLRSFLPAIRLSLQVLFHSRLNAYRANASNTPGHGSSLIVEEAWHQAPPCHPSKPPSESFPVKGQRPEAPYFPKKALFLMPVLKN